LDYNLFQGTNYVEGMNGKRGEIEGNREREKRRKGWLHIEIL